MNRKLLYVFIFILPFLFVGNVSAYTTFSCTSDDDVVSFVTSRDGKVNVTVTCGKLKEMINYNKSFGFDFDSVEHIKVLASPTYETVSFDLSLVKPSSPNSSQQVVLYSHDGGSSFIKNSNFDIGTYKLKKVNNVSEYGNSDTIHYVLFDSYFTSESILPSFTHELRIDEEGSAYIDFNFSDVSLSENNYYYKIETSYVTVTRVASGPYSLKLQDYSDVKVSLYYWPDNVIMGNSELVDETTIDVVDLLPKYQLNLYNNLDDSVVLLDLPYRYSLSISDIRSLYPSIDKIGYKIENLYTDSNYENVLQLPSIITNDRTLYIKYELAYSNEYLDLTKFTKYTFDTNYKYAVIYWTDKSEDKYLGLDFLFNGMELHQYQDDNTFKSVCISPSYHFGDYYLYKAGRKENEVFIIEKEQLITFEKLIYINHFDYILSNGAIVTYTNDLSNISFAVVDKETGETSTVNKDLTGQQGSTNNKEESAFNNYFNELVYSNSFTDVFKYIGSCVSTLYNSLPLKARSYFFYSFMLSISLIILKIFH